MIVIIVLILLISSSFDLSGAAGECDPTRCSAAGPIIRYPFRLIGHQPQHCGYPGFDLSCNSNITLLNFQFPVRASARNITIPITATASVQEIDYDTQVIRVSVLNGSCLPARVPNVSSSASPFQMYYGLRSGYTLFNCSSRPGDRYGPSPVTCLDRGGYRVFAYGSYYSFSELTLPMCVKMYNISDVSEVILHEPMEYSVVDDTLLQWLEPGCVMCKSDGARGVQRSVIIVLTVVGCFLTTVALAL